jgi:endonuclease/exonuclease/phosphatase family metal-dependent hydrolase
MSLVVQTPATSLDAAPSEETMPNARDETIRVATLNLRNRSDRWSERADLLIAQLVELHPDVIGFQEVRRPFNQAGWILRQVNRRLGGYQIIPAWKTGARQFWEGIAVLTRLPILQRERLDLQGGNRVAQRVRVRLTSGALLDVYNTHLPHAGKDEALRLVQVRRILAWMAASPATPAVLVGDFNAAPESASVRAVAGRLRSAYFDVHHTEPEATAPTPLSPSFGAPGHAIDYIFVDEAVAVLDAWLTFDRPHPADEQLLASDHYGIAADIRVMSDE